jgi:HSP20 family protein
MLLRWNPHDPWRDVRALQRQMDAVFADLLPGGRRAGYPATGSGPAFNVADLGDKYLVEAELPGVDEDALTIEATANSLTVKGKRSVTAPEGYAAHRTERNEAEFSRAFTFESKLDLEQVSARLDQGLLRIELGKQALEKPRTITLTTA